MVSIKTPFVLGGIAIALIVLFLSISRFGIPALNQLGASAGSAFSNIGTGFADFFNSVESDRSTTNQESIRRADPNDPFFKSSEPSKGFPQDSIGELDPKSEIFQEDANQILTRDFGITGPPAQITVLDSGGLKIQDVNKSDDTRPFDLGRAIGNFFNVLPKAQAEESQPISLDPNRPLTLDAFAKQSSNSKTRLKSKPKARPIIQGNVRSELDTNQEFKAFSESSSPVIGVIRKTKQNPKKLRTDSKNTPIETASQRANRVFVETGEFADEGRGFGVTKARTKTRNFKFGTNTGSGSSTSGNSATQRLEERKKLAEEKALKVFDSGGISKF